jgi:hypothetical protein
MPGRPRFSLAALPFYLIQRGNNRGACFFAESDYTFCLKEERGPSDQTCVRQSPKLFDPGVVTRYDPIRFANVEMANAGSGSNESHAGAAADAGYA